MGVCEKCDRWPAVCEWLETTFRELMPAGDVELLQITAPDLPDIHCVYVEYVQRSGLSAGRQLQAERLVKAIIEKLGMEVVFTRYIEEGFAEELAEFKRKQELNLCNEHELTPDR